MSIRISEEAECEYNKIIAARNFRQKEQIISAYNDSIKCYKRFRTAILERNYNMAAQELSNAALKLAAAVEWSEKYVVFHKYNLLLQLNPNSSEYNEWDRKCRFVKLVEINGSVKERNMTTHDLFQIIKRDFQSELAQVGIIAFSNMDNESVRSGLINGYKHDGTQPDSSAYIQTMDELYKFITTLVLSDEDKNELKGITDNYPDSWEELFISCGYFKPNRSRRYILLTDCIDNEEIIRNLFRIDWDLVLDLSYQDTNDSRKDLFDQYVSLSDRKTVAKKYLCDFTSSEQLPVTPQTYWIKVNGRKNTVKTKDKILDDKHLASQYIGRHFSVLLDAFAREYDLNIELVVLGCSSFVRATNRILQTFGDIYRDSEDLRVHFLDSDNIAVKNNILSGNSVDEEICKFYDLSLEDLSREIAANIGEYNQVSENKLYIPSVTPEHGYVDFDTYNAMRSVMELVYIDIDKSYDVATKQERGIAFLRGDIPADWDIINDSNYVITQKNELGIRDDIIRHIRDGSRFVYNVEYEAGLGGTTFMRKMAYLLHDDYPTVIVSRYIEKDLVNYLLEIYRRSLKGIVIFVDSNNLSFNEASKLQSELFRNSQFSFVIVYIARKQEGVLAERHLIRFSYSQCLEMQNNLLPHSTNMTCAEKLKACVERARISQMGEEALPFVLAMYAFDEKFNGIETYVKHSLKPIGKREKDIVFVLALADYANYKVSGQFFKSVYSAQTLRLMQSDGYALAPMIKTAYDVSGKKIAFQLKYSLFTKEVLTYFSGGKNISFDALSDRIIDIIESSRRDEYSEADEETVKLLNKLFIERDGNEAENEINIKGVYSPLITQLVEENRRYNRNQYDDSENAVINIFHALVETYPEQPHFAGHLARYYFYTVRNYNMGFEVISDAIQNAKEKEQYSFGSLYHIKAMGYSARVQRLHIDAIKSAIAHSRKINSYEEDLESIVQCMKEIQSDRAFALELFEEARQENTSRFVSNIAECELSLRIQSCYDLIRGWCVDFKITEIVTDKDQLELYDQIDNLIEDCEIIVSGGKGEINNHNMALLKRIKEDILLTRAKGVEIENICRQLISSGTPDIVKKARRKLARIQYAEIQDNLYTDKSQEKLREIVAMMEENIENDASNNANFRIWFKALRALEVEDTISELESAFKKLDNWTSLEITSPDAFYYKYIVKFIQAYEEGVLETSSKVQSDLSDLLVDLKNVSGDLLKKTIPFEWIADYGTGLRRLIPNSELNQMDRTSAITTLHSFTGELPNKDSFNGRKAYITFGRQSVYFNPQSISDRITGIQENQYVDFGIGFSYDGLRSYHDSIKIHRGIIESKENVIPEIGKRVKVKILGSNSKYVKTEIVQSGGEKCDIKIEDMSILGITNDNWNKKGFEFEVVLLKKNLISNDNSVWWIDLQKTVCSMDESGGNRPFAHLKELLKSNG
ncbi:MAG: hypothetical protein HFH12_06400 [Dorea sp.]|nr:hypothetical protein [Dorea sp.]